MRHLNQRTMIFERVIAGPGEHVLERAQHERERRTEFVTHI